METALKVYKSERARASASDLTIHQLNPTTSFNILLLLFNLQLPQFPQLQATVLFLLQYGID